MFLKSSKYLLFASVFSMLVVLSGSFFPFIGGKYYFFRIVIEAALACFLIHWAWEDTKGETGRRVLSFVKDPVSVAVTAFAFFFLLAALFAYNPQGAFWSNFERGEGAFQMLHYFAFFFLMRVVLRSREDWNWMFRWSVISGICMILYGIAANLFIPGFVGPYNDLIGKPGGETFFSRLFAARFQGSLGNPAYVAPALLFCFFFLASLWIHEEKMSWPRRSAYIAISVFFLVFFILSQTRGAFLGLLAAGGIFLLYLIIRSKKWRAKGIGVLVACLVVFATLFALRNNPVIQNLPGGRLLSLGLHEEAAQTRLWTWNSAWQGFLDRPILGWGPENFATVFDKYFDPRHYVPGQNSETWFDRAHSIVFDYLAEGGLLTFLAYLFIFIFFYRAFWRSQISKKTGASSPHSPLFQALVFAMPVAYLVQGLVLFDVLPIYVNLFIFLGFSTQFFSQHQ
jgi:O-Antigen ligase